MTDDERFTWGFILEVLDVMERHGYHRSDNQHTGQATRAHPRRGPHLRGHPGRSPRRLRRGAVTPADGTTAARPARHAVIVSADQVNTLLAALDDAAEYKRDRAETCADCADQSCTTCQWRLQAADAYDQMAAQMIHAAEASAARQRAPDHATPPSGGPHAATDPEAGQ